MTDYLIATCLTPSYADALSVFIPSWFRNTQCPSIVIGRLSSPNWLEALVARTKWMAKLIEENLGKRICCLDADVFVLDDLADGFSDEYPISTTRENFNTGVLFFNTAMRFPWSSFFTKLVERVSVYCRSSTLRHGGSDQDVWPDLLNEHGGYRVLPTEIWNFTRPWEYWEEELRADAKVLHVKGNGAWPHHVLQLVRNRFPEKLAYCDAIDDYKC